VANREDSSYYGSFVSKFSRYFLFFIFFKMTASESSRIFALDEKYVTPTLNRNHNNFTVVESPFLYWLLSFQLFFVVFFRYAGSFKIKNTHYPKFWSNQKILGKSGIDLILTKQFYFKKTRIFGIQLHSLTIVTNSTLRYILTSSFHSFYVVDDAVGIIFQPGFCWENAILVDMFYESRHCTVKLFG
jgi:hypothetical protein